jgi:phosphoribosyl 1,2-cyclic phosphate phosphodiesterase
MTQGFRLTLLGTGSSGGVPRVGGDWGRCDPNEPKNRRRRCCVLVDREGADGALTRVLIDTSPDLREQLLAARVQHLDAVLFTHDHADQTHGIDDVRPLVIRTGKRIPAWLDTETAAVLISRFRYCFEGSGGYPAIFERAGTLKPFEALKISGQAGDIGFLPLDLEHGAIRSLGFRMGGLAYVNDVSAIPARSMEALHGLDVLILDALRRTPHPTHAHLERALEWIAALKPKRAVLTNMHTDMDYTTLISELPSGVEPGYDGQVIAFH